MCRFGIGLAAILLIVSTHDNLPGNATRSAHATQEDFGNNAHQIVICDQGDKRRASPLPTARTDMGCRGRHHLDLRTMPPPKDYRNLLKSFVNNLRRSCAIRRAQAAWAVGG